jgi:hypothetical protein
MQQTTIQHQNKVTGIMMALKTQPLLEIKHAIKYTRFPLQGPV